MLRLQCSLISRSFTLLCHGCHAQRWVFHFSELKSGAKDAVAKRVHQHVSWIRVRLSLQPSPQSPDCKAEKKRSVSHRRVELPVVLQKETATCLEPVAGKPLYFTVGPCLNSCRCPFQVGDLACRDVPGFPSGTSGSQANVDVIKIRV